MREISFHFLAMVFIFLILANLAKGIYMAKVSNDNAVESHRLVIQ